MGSNYPIFEYNFDSVDGSFILMGSVEMTPSKNTVKGFGLPPPCYKVKISICLLPSDDFIYNLLLFRTATPQVNASGFYTFMPH